MPLQALPAYVVTLLFFAGFLLRYPNIPNYWSRPPLALCALLQDPCHLQLMRPCGFSAQRLTFQNSFQVQVHKFPIFEVLMILFICRVVQLHRLPEVGLALPDDQSV